MSTMPPTPSRIPRLVADLCRLRGNPQDFPYSPNLLACLIGADIALGAVLGSVNEAANALARSLLATTIVLFLCWIALLIRGLSHRFVQTASALLACSVALALLQLPLSLLFDPNMAKVGDIQPLATVLLQFVVRWASITLFVWQIAIDAHIVRHAMEAGFGFALLLVGSWILASWSIDSLFFGAG